MPQGGPGQGRTGERPVLRTGERPALPTGTGERPALPTGTGERPVLRTGERPALPQGERGQSRTTGSRPALPAATFADALTTTKEGGKRVSTAPETLVMPKVVVPEPSGMPRGGKTKEMPAYREGKGQQPSETSTPKTPREGPTVTTMSTPIDRGGTRLFRMPEPPGGKERAEGEETLPGREGKELRRGGGRPGDPRSAGKSPERDNFGTTPSTGNRPALSNAQVKGPVLPVKDLIPSSLGKLGDLLSVAKRFASDFPLLHQQIRPSDLPSTDRALRAWAFFTAYAEAAVAHEPTEQGKEVFDKALKEQGFGEYRDARTGKDGAKAAKWVLESSNPQEARERASQVEIEPPPEVRLSESEAARKSETAQPQEAARKSEDPPKASSQAQEAKDAAATLAKATERAPLERVEGQPELVRVNPQLADAPRPVMQQANPELRRREDEESLASRADDAWKKLSGNLKLGGNMLWNVLHRLRGGKEDSALEKEKWNQIAFAAMLAFVGLMLLVILVVSL